MSPFCHRQTVTLTDSLFHNTRATDFEEQPHISFPANVSLSNLKTETRLVLHLGLLNEQHNQHPLENVLR